MDANGIVTFRDGDKIVRGKNGVVFVRAGKAYSANRLRNHRFEIRYEVQTKRDCKNCGLNPDDYGITRD